MKKVFSICLAFILLSGCALPSSLSGTLNDTSSSSAVSSIPETSSTSVASSTPETSSTPEVSSTSEASTTESRLDPADETLETGYHYFYDIEMPIRSSSSGFYFYMTADELLEAINQKGTDTIKNFTLLEKSGFTSADTIILEGSDVTCTLILDSNNQAIKTIFINSPYNFFDNRDGDFLETATIVLMTLDPNMSYKFAQMHLMDIAMAGSLLALNTEGFHEADLGRIHYKIAVDADTTILELVPLENAVEEE